MCKVSFHVGLATAKGDSGCATNKVSFHVSLSRIKGEAGAGCATNFILDKIEFLG